LKRATTIETQSERIDDLPVVIHWLEKMAVQKWLDEELPTPHGNRQGLSYGAWFKSLDIRVTLLNSTNLSKAHAKRVLSFIPRPKCYPHLNLAVFSG
jgi:hypothetical protein